MKKKQTSNRERIKTIAKISAYIALGVTLNLLESFLVPLG